MWWFGLLIGVVVGYFFKPQLDGIVHKAKKYIEDNRKDDDF